MIKVIEAIKPDFPPEFPRLMIGVGGTVVLFITEGKGTVLKNGKEDKYTVGWYSETWIKTNFKPYTSSLTLRNQE